ncbi:replication fork protection component Swi3-domain-containing protein [Fomitopsis betulina]|nr:replication fork protection component Swi3-domain-containing protein [Fomitopsis betulina]
MTSLALEDIWDAPAEEVPRRSSSPIDLTANASPRRGSKRPRSTLFLDSDSEDEGHGQPARKSAAPPARKSDIDAMFDNLDAEPDASDGDLPPALNLDALRRQEDAKNAQRYKKPSALDLDGPEANGDAGGDAKGKDGGKEKQKRKPLPRLDEARLLGQDGLPALVKQAKTFKPKGKGHEATDLNRLLQVYQFWTHKMFPKTPFTETTKRVEKLCHSKRMHVALTVWRDEYKGINRGHNVNLGSDDSSDEDGADDGAPVTAASKEVEDDVLDATGIDGPSSRAPSHPPSSEPPSSDGFDDFDLDAMIREEEERQAAESRVPEASVPRTLPTAAQDEDDAMWDASDDKVADNTGPAPTQYATMSGPAQDEDEDMWDAIKEMEAADSGTGGAAPGSLISGPQVAATTQLEQALGDPRKPSATNDEGWDEMYA